MKIRFAKVRDVKTPNRGTTRSAGIDFFVPNDYPGEAYLALGQSILIPSGIHVKVPKGYALIAMNKSGVATKKGLQVGACVVDEDYQGEIHIHVTKVDADDVATISPGEKLIQMLLIPVAYHIPEEMNDLIDLYAGKVTERGAGKMGSTGTT